MRKWIFIIPLILSVQLYSQSNKGVKIGGDAIPHEKAILDITSSDKGLLIPRLLTSERTSLFSGSDVSAMGLIVFDINLKSFYFYSGSKWVKIKNQETLEKMILSNNLLTFTNSIGENIVVDLSNASLSGEIQGKLNQIIINNGVIDSNKIKDGTIENIDIKNRTITNLKIVQNIITAEEIATDAVDSDEIKANAVKSEELASSSVGNDELKNNSVTSNKLSPTSIPAQGVLGINQNGELIWKESASSAEWNILADQKGVTNAIDANYGIAINANEFPLRALHVNDTMRLSHTDNSAVLEFQSGTNDLFSLEQDVSGNFSVFMSENDKFLTFDKTGKVSFLKNVELLNNSSLSVNSLTAGSLTSNGAVEIKNTLTITDQANVDFPTHMIIKNMKEAKGWNIYQDGAKGGLRFNHPDAPNVAEFGLEKSGELTIVSSAEGANNTHLRLRNGDESNSWRIYNSADDGGIYFNHDEDDNYEIGFTKDGQLKIQDSQNTANPTHIFLKNQLSPKGWRVYQASTSGGEGLYFNYTGSTQFEFGIRDNGAIRSRGLESYGDVSVSGDVSVTSDIIATGNITGANLDLGSNGSVSDSYSIKTKYLKIDFLTSNSESEINVNRPIKFSNESDADNPTHLRIAHKNQTKSWRIYQANTSGGLYFNHTGTDNFQVGFLKTGNLVELSDIRVKENINPIKKALNKINQLNFVEYNKKGFDIKEYGVIAQQLRSIIPFAVSINPGTITDKNGNKVKVNDLHSVNYKMVSILGLKALQELKIEKDEEINQLKKEVEKLKNNNLKNLTKLEKEINSIKNANEKLIKQNKELADIIKNLNAKLDNVTIK